MVVNKPSGNMYPWAYTWNPLGGKCLHECSYCYVDDLRIRGLKKYFGDPRFDELAFKDNLTVPKHFAVFVQSCGDLFGYWIRRRMIRTVLDYIKGFPRTTFLLQTKNPERFFDFNIPENCILGTTIETNRDTSLISKAPSPNERYVIFAHLRRDHAYPLTVSLEPILDFDMHTLVFWMKDIEPKFVSIGTDSGGHQLPEPSPEKIQSLIELLSTFTEVRVKKNLKRLMEKKTK